ncbi:MAG: (d)CMP kinase [Acidimicrobiales bacterium]
MSTPSVRVVRTVAIDGPAGAGKSTLARALARHFGLDRLDTGAMYRSVAWAALERGVELADGDAVAELARGLVIDVGERVLVDGHDATAAIRSAAVDAAVSVVAANPAVRAELVRRQQAWVAARGGGVVEGRDIGSVVLPGADLKVFLTARVDERARRRAAERGAPDAELAAVAAAIDRRDTLDSSRPVSPLPTADRPPPGAVVVDSTGKPAQAVLEEVLACL